MTKRNTRTNPGSYEELKMWAEMLADAIDVRVAFQNREKSASVNSEAFAATVEMYKAAEENIRRELEACYKVTVPASLRRWQEETPSVGAPTLARLLGITGDPRLAKPMHWEGTGDSRVLVADEPHFRTVSQLWRYCGHGPVKNRNVKGDAAALAANGSPDAKKLVHLMAEAQVKGRGAYRDLYDTVKEKYAGQVHAADCEGGFYGNLYVKCKVQGEDGKFLRYAQAGDPFQKSHVSAIALRRVGKEILKDLWLAAGPPVPGWVWRGRTGKRDHGRGLPPGVTPREALDAWISA
jgi:hypothetical protein